MMKRVEEINKEIERLSNEYETVTGTPTEVYSRIVGYYRSIKNWNMGKREEYSHRVQFSRYDNPNRRLSPAQAMAEIMNPAASDAFTILYFFRKHCPNCPPVSSMLAERDFPYTAVDVDTEDGLGIATKYNVLSTPTVLAIDMKGEEVFRGSAAKTIIKYLDSSTVKAAYAS